jgi:hypothetical protein
MSRRASWGVAVAACAVAWSLSTPASAWARKSTPKPAPKEVHQEPPPDPPPSFVAPPPGYEPPPPFRPGDDTGPPAPPYEEPLPAFMTLDRIDANTRVAIQAGWQTIDNVSVGDASLVRLEPFGHFVFPNRAGGLYGRVPFVHRFASGADDATAMGNLELGGFFLPTRNSEWIVRAGIAAGTASESLPRAAANFDSRFERLTDYVLVLPRATTLRLSGSTIQQWDKIFLRADLGLDTVLDKPSVPANLTSVFGRGNVAVGLRATGVDFTLELANLAAFNGDTPSGLTGRLLHTAALSVRTPGVDQFHFGMVFPLDNAARGEVWILSLGYQRAGDF